MFRLFVLTFLAVFTVACGETVFQNKTVTTPYISCDPTKDPLELRVKGCSQLPCQFPRRSAQELEVDFLVDEDTEALTPIVMAKVMGIEVQYPLPQKDGCKALSNGECPLKKGEKITYKLSMEISPWYPSVSLGMTLSLLDARKRAITCFKITANVVSSTF